VVAFTIYSPVETIGVQKVEVAEKGGPENGKREIPEHLTNLFDKSKGELNEQEQTQLSELLCEEQTTKQLRQVLNHHTSYDTHVKTYL
jgi:hypothetical protein